MIKTAIRATTPITIKIMFKLLITFLLKKILFLNKMILLILQRTCAQSIVCIFGPALKRQGENQLCWVNPGNVVFRGKTRYVYNIWLLCLYLSHSENYRYKTEYPAGEGRFDD